MIHGKNRRPIRAQNSGSHGSKGPHAAPNRQTRTSGTWKRDRKTHGRPPENLGTWKRDRKTHGRPPEKAGGGWAHSPVGRPPWSAEWAPPPPTLTLGRKLPTTFPKSVQGATHRPTRCKAPNELPL